MPRLSREGEASAGGAGLSVSDLIALAQRTFELQDALALARLEAQDLNERMRALLEEAQRDPTAARQYRELEAKRPAAFYTVRALDALLWLAQHEGGAVGGAV